MTRRADRIDAGRDAIIKRFQGIMNAKIDSDLIKLLNEPPRDKITQKLHDDMARIGWRWNPLANDWQKI